jgi:hypothetical protein
MRTRLAGLVGLLLVVLFPGSAAAATTEATTTQYVLHTAAYEVEDSCNGGIVILHGDFVITQTTTRAADGGTNVRSRIVSTNLQGVNENGLPYRALDAELSFVHELSPQMTQFSDAHATLLLPSANAPKLLLVTVFKETVLPDGTPTVALDQTYTVCLSGRRPRG